ncbi:hypothetical protein CRYUN_Cryun09bG0148200 [Craigia yunnanensis]
MDGMKDRHPKEKRRTPAWELSSFFVAVERDEWKSDTFCDLYDMLTIIQAVIFYNTK